MKQLSLLLFAGLLVGLAAAARVPDGVPDGASLRAEQGPRSGRKRPNIIQIVTGASRGAEGTVLAR